MNHTIRNYREYGFDDAPFLSDEYKDKYFKLVLAQEKIKQRLKGNENFNGIDFSDVHANGIQIGIRNKKIPYITSGATIKYDFSNIDEAVEEAIQGYLDNDNEESIKRANDFYEQGCKYGWD